MRAAPPAPPVAHGVLGQVADQALEQHLVAADARRAELQPDVDAGRGGLAGDGGGGPPRDRREVDRVVAPRALGADREQEQPVEQQLRAVGRLDHGARDLAQLLGARVRVVERDLRLGAHDRQRGAQLVRGVGDEAALRLDGALDAVEHRVEGDGQLVQLVGAAGGPHARVEPVLGDPAQRRRDRADRGQRAPGRQPADAERHQRRARDRERVLQAELPEHAARVLGRQGALEVAAEQPPAQHQQQRRPGDQQPDVEEREPQPDRRAQAHQTR